MKARHIRKLRKRIAKWDAYDIHDTAAYGFTTDEEVAEYYAQMNMNAIYAMQGYLGIWE